MNVPSLIAKARDSRFYLWVLNTGLDRMIPFNKPHGFRIIDIEKYAVRTRIPYKRRNFNHIKGLHACALATLSEFTTGFLLIANLDPKKYRLIMQKLEMDYHYQGKMDAVAEFRISDQWLKENIIHPLEDKDAVMITCVVQIRDVKNNLLTTGHVHWQVKSWEKVRTKVT